MLHSVNGCGLFISCSHSCKSAALMIAVDSCSTSVNSSLIHLSTSDYPLPARHIVISAVSPLTTHHSLIFSLLP